MTKIKMCGMCRIEDIEYANKILPEFVGYIFAEKSRRYISPEKAVKFTEILDSRIIPVGVFVNADMNFISDIADRNIIEFIQLHGDEDDNYISSLRNITSKPIIRAFKIRNREDIERAENSQADIVLLDSGEGSGHLFNHELIKDISRPYILAGGLNPENIGGIIRKLNPYAADVSSGIETDGIKDFNKMKAFADAGRKIL
ncbi:MAG: phosphoribosylanthranilate isomerase [Ruminococcus sp.]|nr:phosphoribosylanthranilate isomerase [Ruminococcus sp.]